MDLKTSPATRDLPPPLPGTGDCWYEIIDSWCGSPEMLPLFIARRQVGFARYGQPVQHGDGRGIDDALQEALDLAVYLWREGLGGMAMEALDLADRIRLLGVR